jgi:hypothetical protein
MPQTGGPVFQRRGGPGCVSGGSVAAVLGAVTGIESKAVIDGTSLLSGAISQDRSAFSSARQGAPQPGDRNPRAGRPCRP